MVKEWTIGDDVERAGEAATTNRYNEENDLLPPASRVNGRRRYDQAILEKLNTIRLAQRAGYTLDEIQTLLHDFPADTPPSARWQAMAQEKLQELDERMRTIQAMKAMLERTLECECETLEECGERTEDSRQRNS